MVIETLASGAVSLLVPYLAKAGNTIAEKVGKDSWDIVNSKIEKLYETVKSKITGNDYASQTLKRLEEKPEDADRQSAMKSVLKDILIDDQQFQKTLSQLLDEVKQTGGKNIQFQDNGAISFGGEIKIKGEYAAGRDNIINK